MPRSAPLRAQAADQRAAIEAWRDTLSQINDTILLLRRERLLIIDAKADRNNAMIHLRLGFLSLRFGDLVGTPHYDDAASEFEWATQLQPTWPYGWYGLGLAELGVGDSQIALVTGLKSMFGKDALAKSAQAFAQSAVVDPELRDGAGGTLQHRAPPAGQHPARRGAQRAPARRAPPRPPRTRKCSWRGAGWSARWGAPTPRRRPSRGTSRRAATRGWG